MSRFVRSCLRPVSAVLTVGAVGGAAGNSFAGTLIEPEKPHSRENQARESLIRGKSGPDKSGEASAEAKQSSAGQKVEHIHVIGHPFNTLHASNDLGRLPQDVLHTPQTIDVVPAELIKQQNVKSLDEALKNVPGVTASVGEGAGGLSGDQFLIRGFPAQNDIYEDGLRDFGVYSRDNFNYDSINVIKGPSSQVFGNGTTGGAINAVTKTPALNDWIGADFSGGSGQYYRGTIDVNKKLAPHTAFRMQAMGNQNNVVGRDYIYSHRWGIAPSLSFGLGTKTNVVLQVMHLENNGVPDYGVPVVTLPGRSVGKPVTEYGIPRTNWYGKQQDHDRTRDTMETLRLSHKFNDHVTLHNDMRFGEFSRNFETSKASCNKACIAALASGNPQDAWISRTTNKGPYDTQHPDPGGNDALHNAAGAPQPYTQSSWSFQDVASTTLDFKTGFVKHQMVTGFDIEYAHDNRHQYTYLTPVHKANLLNPDPYDVGTLQKVRGSRAPYNLARLPGLGQKSDSNGYAFDAGIFLYDQIWLRPWLSLKGGFRWDRWQTQYNAKGGNMADPNTSISNTKNVVNPTASLLIMPNKMTTFYFTYATSTTPLGMYVTSGALPIRPSATGATVAKPEKANLYEVGAKVSAFQDRLGLTASLFRLEKNNALTTDPMSGQTLSTGDSQRNQGMELSVSGVILPHWNVTATYAYYDPTTTASQKAAYIGKNIQYVPHNQATLWTAYQAFHHTPWNVTIGGGMTWRQHVWLDQANTVRVPANLEFDAMLAHRINHNWTLSLNGYNLANRLNYGSLFVNRVTPAPGRTFLGRISMKY